MAVNVMISSAWSEMSIEIYSFFRVVFSLAR